MNKLFPITADSVANHIFEEYLSAHWQKHKDGTFLDMGCGNNKVDPSFIGVDPYAESANVQAYMWDTPFEDNSIDLILCFAALEHVSKFHVIPSLKEFARIMKPGALLGIIVPNLLYAMAEWAKNQNTGWEMDLIFGTQIHEGEYHRTGFSVPIIKGYFDNIPELEILNIYDINGYTQWNYGVIARKY